MKEQQQLAEMAAARSANPEPPQTGFQLKWAETKNPPTVVKSLAEIQAEEQKQLAKVIVPSSLLVYHFSIFFMRVLSTEIYLTTSRIVKYISSSLQLHS